MVDRAYPPAGYGSAMVHLKISPRRLYDVVGPSGCWIAHEVSSRRLLSATPHFPTLRLSPLCREQRRLWGTGRPIIVNRTRAVTAFRS